MRIRITELCLISMAVLLCGASQAVSSTESVIRLGWSPGEVSLVPAGGNWVEVSMPGGLSMAEPGAPDLPWVVVPVRVAPGERVVSWNWTPEATGALGRGLRPVPALEDRPVSMGGPIPADPLPGIYAGSAPYPEVEVVHTGVQSSRGVVDASFLICPFRWDPRDGSLALVTDGVLRIVTGPSPDGGAETLMPLRLPLGRRADPAKAGGDGSLLHSLDGGLPVSDMPALESIPVEYLIVTTGELEPVFRDLADWKTRTGYPAAIRTVDWISDRYPEGVDLAESIRLFIRDAYQLWGTTTVLMGGDPIHIPMRRGHSYSHNLPAGTSVPTDYYYACLDGNWNANGNLRFGEAVHPTHSPVDDRTDLRPDVRVGRVSVMNAAEARVWVDKYMTYVQNDARLEDAERNRQYLPSFATLGEVLFPTTWRVGHRDDCSVGDESIPCVTTDGANDCFLVVDYVKASLYADFFEFDELYERHYWWNPRRGIESRPLSRASALAALNEGRNIVFHMGHGDRDRWAVGPGRVLLSDAAAMTNAPFYHALAYAVNCNSAAVEAHCFAEAWMAAPDGGGVSYLGSTDAAFPASARQTQRLFFRRWMNDEFTTAGDAYYAAADTIGMAAGESPSRNRFMLYSMVFLGDPDMIIWRDVPGEMTVDVPSAIPLGSGPVAVTVSLDGQPLHRARVCLYKEGDAMAVGETAESGVVSLPFFPGDTGSCLITVTHPRGLPYEDEITVTGTASSFAFASGIRLADTTDSGVILGNGNGRIEVGETVALDLTVTNRGQSIAGGVTARLVIDGETPDLDVALVDSVAFLGNIAPQGIIQADNAFVLTVREAEYPATDRREADLPIRISWESGDGSSHEQHKVLTVFRPDLELISTRFWELEAVGEPDSLPNVGETMAIVTKLYSRGDGEWSHLRGRLVPSNPTAVTLIDSVASFGEVGPNSIAESDTFRFEVRMAQNLSMNFILEDTLDASAGPKRLWSRLLRLSSRPQRPDSLITQGSPSYITLSWDDNPSNDPDTNPIWGYRVYASDSPDGPFETAGAGFVQGMRVYADEGLPSQTRRYYQVSAVDSSGIESRKTPVTAGSSSPGTLAGWPNVIHDARDVAPAIANLNGWGDPEIIIGSNVIYAYNSDGTDYHDGDNNPSTRGPLTEHVPGRWHQAKSAVADLSGNGEMELIVLATAQDDASNWLPARLIVYDDRGRTKWERTLANRPAVSSPAVGNIDDDAELEIVFLLGRHLYAFNHDGTPFHGSTGRMDMITTGGDWQYGSVALADLDQDGRDEIIFTTSPISDQERAKLFVVKGVDDSGNVGIEMPGFPITYSDFPNTASDQNSNSSPAIGDVTSKATGEPDDKPDIIVASRTWLWAFDPTAPGSRPQDKLVWRVSLASSRREDPLTPSPALGDINGDGQLNVVVTSGNGQTTGLGYLHVLDGRRYPPPPTDPQHHTSVPLPGFSESAAIPYLRVGSDNARIGSPILANLDDDPRPEIIVGDSNGFVFALQSDGTMLDGFPFRLPGGRIGTGLAAWDVNRNGFQNLVIQAANLQHITVLEFPNSPFDPAEAAISNPWPQFRRDPRNTGFVTGDAPISIHTMAVVAQALDGLEAELSWSTELQVARFLVHRSLDPGGDWELVSEWSPFEIQEEPGRYRLVDPVPGAGTWSYRIEALDVNGRLSLTGTAVITVGAGPLSFALHPARPNPFNPRTLIMLDLPGRGECMIEVLDVSGRVVRTLWSGQAGPGTLSLEWDGRDAGGRDVSSGIYFLRAHAEGQGRASRKMVLLK